jgi:hypothetical protein
MLNNQTQSLTEEREQLLKRCRDALILGHITSELQYTYDGYGDSGGIDQIETIPENTELENHLKDFMDRLVYQTNPGYEINEGGGGNVTWDINADKIYISHYQNVTTQQESEYEL